MDATILKLYAALFFTMFYPVFIVFFVISIQLGFWGWLVFFLLLSPPTVVWYIVVKKRMINFIKILMETRPKPWDVNKAVEDYVELLRKQKKVTLEYD